MNHLSKTRMRLLARIVLDDLPLDGQDARELSHLSDCEPCRQYFLCAMALADAVSSAGFLARERAAASKKFRNDAEIDVER